MIRKNPLKIAVSIEEYLSNIDIGLLDVPTTPINSIGEVMTLIGAKDEREAIGIMYQALSLIEVYFNRRIQHLLISMYNIDKTNAGKSINDYFESEFFIVDQLLQQYKGLMLKNKKTDSSSEPGLKYKKLQGEHDALRAKFDKLSKKCETLEKNKQTTGLVNSSELVELKATIAELDNQQSRKTVDKKEIIQLNQ